MIKKALVVAMAVSLAILSGCSQKAVTLENGYENEINGQLTLNELKDQRPVAVVTGTGTDIDADIIYEYSINKETTNTALIKNWKDIKSSGDIKPITPTEEQIIAEWDALAVESGEPSTLPYIDTVKTDKLDGKSVQLAIKNQGFSETYNDYYSGPHFTFDGKSPEYDPLPENARDISTGLRSFSYDSQTGAYISDKTEYANIILQETVLLDKEEPVGYFNLCDSNRNAWLFRDGMAIPLTWTKLNDVSHTDYYDLEGKKAVLKPGKTYISLIPDRDWANIAIK